MLDLLLNPIALTLIVGMLGILATLKAPSLSPKAAVRADLVSVNRIVSDHGPNQSHLQIFVDERQIEHEVVNCQIRIENCGSKDIRGSNFVDPIQIEFPHESTLLTTNLIDTDKTGAQFYLDNNAIQLQWSLLKKKERIELNALLEVDTNKTPIREIEDKISTNIRLVDVSDNSRKSNIIQNTLVSLFVFLVFMGALGAAMYYDRDYKSFFYVEYEDSNLPIIMTSNRFLICNPSQSPFSLRDCDMINGAGTYTIHSYDTPIDVGVPAFYAIAAPFFSILYSIILSSAFWRRKRNRRNSFSTFIKKRLNNYR